MNTTEIISSTVEMVGTEKQIAWAQDIRHEKMWDWDHESGRGHDGWRECERPKFGKVRNNADEFAAEIFAITDAKWWIDNRTITIGALVGNAVRDHMLALVTGGMTKEEAVASVSPEATA